MKRNSRNPYRQPLAIKLYDGPTEDSKEFWGYVVVVLCILAFFAG